MVSRYFHFSWVAAVSFRIVSRWPFARIDRREKLEFRSKFALFQLQARSWQKIPESFLAWCALPVIKRFAHNWRQASKCACNGQMLLPLSASGQHRPRNLAHTQLKRHSFWLRALLPPNCRSQLPPSRPLALYFHSLFVIIHWPVPLNKMLAATTVAFVRLQRS